MMILYLLFLSLASPMLFFPAKYHALALDNIVNTALASNDISTFGEFLQGTNLDGILSGVGPFTVFAPTNDAFQRDIPPEIVGDLLDSGELANILKYHVVLGQVPSGLITDGSTLPTLDNGGDLSFVVFQNATITVNDVVITTLDIAASNGVIHVIGSVLRQEVFPTRSPVKTSSPSRITPSPTSSPTRKASPTIILLPTKSPVTDPVCVDSPLDFVIPINGKERSCNFVGSVPSKVDIRCRRKSVKNHCSLTCGICPECRDSTMPFKLKDGRKRSCNWVKRNPLNVAARCNLEGVKDTCRVTCGTC